MTGVNLLTEDDIYTVLTNLDFQHASNSPYCPHFPFILPFLFLLIMSPSYQVYWIVFDSSLLLLNVQTLLRSASLTFMMPYFFF